MTTSPGDRLVGAFLPILGVLIALTAAGCATTPPAGPTSTPSGIASTATSRADATRAPSQPTANASDLAAGSTSADPLVGTWTTGAVTCDQWNAAIAKAYTHAQIAKYDADSNTHECPASFTIRFRGMHLVIFVNDEVGWDSLYRLKAPDQIEAGDNCAYCWLYRYRLSGDVLTIDLINDGDAVDPVLDGIVQTGIYESTVFKRVP
jgi:hypothetical protein